MKLTTRTTRAALLLTLAAAAACAAENYFISGIPVASFTAPATHSANQTMHLVLNVVTSSCVQFEKFEMVRRPERVTILAEGRQNLDVSNVCTAGTIISPQPLDLAPPFTFPFTIEVLVPGDTSLVATVQDVNAPAPTP